MFVKGELPLAIAAAFEHIKNASFGIIKNKKKLDERAGIFRLSDFYINDNNRKGRLVLMKKIFVAAAVALAASVVSAIDFANVVTTFNDKSVKKQKVGLKEVAKDVFRLQIPIREIPLDADFIDIKLPQATAKKGEAGYWVLGDGRMGTFKADNGLVNERRNPLPLYGVKKGNSAFVGIVKGLKYEFSARVEVKNGAYEIYPRFLIKDMFFSPYEDLIIDFYTFKGDAANYSSMGKAYRDYQLARGEVLPLRERVKGNPQLAYTADTMFVRFSHGTKNNSAKIIDQTPQNEPKVKAHRTFEQTKKNILKLKEMGIEKAEICLVGWNSGGFDGRFPTLFPADPAFGGEEKMKEVVDTAHNIGYQIVVHVCNTDFYSISDRFDKKDIAKRPDGSLHHHSILAGGRAYFPCFQQVYNNYIFDDFEGLKARGFKGTHHIDVTSCIIPYPCYDPKHPCNRQQTADYMNKIGALADKYFGGWGSEGPCDHVAKTLDYVLYVWAYPQWLGRETPLMDRLVPIWQIAYHGIIISNPYYATIDYTYEKETVESIEKRSLKRKKKIPYVKPYHILGSKQLRKMKVAEFGGRPTFYRGIRDDNLAPLKEAYDEYQPMKYLQYEFMDFHGELAKDVFVTRYSDGSEVVTNYSDKPFEYKKQTIAPMDYRLFKLSPEEAKKRSEAAQKAAAKLAEKPVADSSDSAKPKAAKPAATQAKAAAPAAKAETGFKAKVKAWFEAAKNYFKK